MKDGIHTKITKWQMDLWERMRDKNPLCPICGAKSQKKQKTTKKMQITPLCPICEKKCDIEWKKFANLKEIYITKIEVRKTYGKRIL